MDDPTKFLCAECTEPARSFSLSRDQKEVALVCSQVCSDKFWTKKRASEQEPIGFLVSSDPGFVPGVDNEVIDRSVRTIAGLPYAPAHQWFTQQGIKGFERRYTPLRYRNSEVMYGREVKYDSEISEGTFNYFHGLRYLYKEASKRNSKLFPEVPSEDLEFYNFSGRALVAGVIFNDAPSFYAKHPDAWKMYIDKDIRAGDESYTRRLMKAYNLTYEDYNLSQEYHYNPSISKIVALAKFGAQAKASALINETLDKYYGGDAAKKLGVVSRDVWVEWILPYLAKANILASNVAEFSVNAAKIAVDKTVPDPVRKFFADPYRVRQMQNFISWLPLAGAITATTTTVLTKSLDIPAWMEEVAPWLDAAGKWVYQLFQTDQDVLDAQGDPSYQKWHSMSRPREFNETNGSLQDEIIELLASWMREALDTHSVFSLGHIFHCIQDSFSRSHTRRALRTNPVTVTKKLPGDISIVAMRYTKLIGFQHYDDELDHPPSDTWIAAIGRNPKTMQADPEFTARRDECISTLEAVASLYYHFFVRVAREDMTEGDVAAWKETVIDALKFILREVPYSMDERDRKVAAGGSYKSIMRPTILYRVCTKKREGEEEDYCRVATKEEEEVIKKTPFNLKVNMTLHEERITKRIIIKVLPTYTESDVVNTIIEKLTKENIKVTPADIRVYFSDDDALRKSNEDIIPANPVGAGGILGFGLAAIKFMKKQETLAHLHLENNDIILAEKQKDIGRFPAVRLVKELWERYNSNED